MSKLSIQTPAVLLLTQAFSLSNIVHACSTSDAYVEAFWAKPDGNKEQWLKVSVVQVTTDQKYHVKWDHSPELCLNIVSGFWGKDTPFYAGRSQECIKNGWEVRKGTGSSGFKYCEDAPKGVDTTASKGFMDTENSAMNNDYTGESSVNQANDEWTASAMPVELIVWPIVGVLLVVLLCGGAYIHYAKSHAHHMADVKDKLKYNMDASGSWGHHHPLANHKHHHAREAPQQANYTTKINPAKPPTSNVPPLELRSSIKIDGTRSRSRSITPRKSGAGDNTPPNILTPKGSIRSGKPPSGRSSQPGQQNLPGFGRTSQTSSRGYTPRNSTSKQSVHSQASRTGSRAGQRSLSGTPRYSTGGTTPMQTPVNPKIILEMASAGGDGGSVPHRLSMGVGSNALPRFGADSV